MTNIIHRFDRVLVAFCQDRDPERGLHYVVIPYNLRVTQALRERAARRAWVLAGRDPVTWDTATEARAQYARTHSGRYLNVVIDDEGWLSSDSASFGGASLTVLED